jgi:hypothetical protein
MSFTVYVGDDVRSLRVSGFFLFGRLRAAFAVFVLFTAFAFRAGFFFVAMMPPRLELGF